MAQKRVTAGASTVVLLLAIFIAAAQAQQMMRLRGVIEGVNGKTLMARSDKGDQLKLDLAEKMLVVDVVKASMAEIKEGSFIGSGAMPQPDGSQKALEVHIFAETQRGTGEGHRPWDGAPNSTMTNGTVGATVTGVEGGTITVKYKEGEKQIVVPPGVPIVRYEIGNAGDLKPGASFSVIAATKKGDGSFEVARINVGRDGLVP
jgi:hypothetical protein